MGTLNWEVEFECQVDHTTGLTNHPNFVMNGHGDSGQPWPYGWADYLPYKISNLDEVIEMIKQGRTPRPDCKFRHGKPVLKKRLLHPKVCRSRARDRDDATYMPSMMRARRRAIRFDDGLQDDDRGDMYVPSAGESFFAWRYFHDEDVWLVEDQDLPSVELEFVIDSL